MRKQILAAALLFALLLLAGCQEETVEVPDLKEPVGVQSDMAEVRADGIYQMEVHDGQVVPYVEELCFEVDGRVKRMLVYPGMIVQEGDVLIELDQEAEEKQAEQMRRELEYLEKDYAYSDALAEIDINFLEVNLHQLRAQGADAEQIALAELDIEQRKAQLRQEQQMREPELDAKRKALEKVEQGLEETCLRAPFSGRVMYYEQGLAEGYWAQAYAPLIYLADDSRVHLRSEYISETVLRTASRVYARIGADDYEIKADPVDQAEYISAALSGATLYTTFRFTGVEEGADYPEVGQYAAICMIRGYIPEALVVPSGAVLRDAGGRYVYVDADGERVRRAVKVGTVTDGLTQILEGLEEGEVVYVKD